MFEREIAFTGEYAAIPKNMQESMLGYVFENKPVGSFLEAVICNDLKGAFGRADSTNLPLLHLYVLWFYNVCPAHLVGLDNYVCHTKNKSESVTKIG